MNSDEVWFSHREKIFQVKDGTIEWTDETKIWNWDRCTISLVKSPKKKLRVVVRSNANRNQTSFKVNRPMTLRYMLGFDIDRVYPLKCESPASIRDLRDGSQLWTGPGDRWVFQLDEDYWIWEYKDGASDITSSNVFKIHQQILENLSGTKQDGFSEVFNLQPQSLSDRMVIDHLQSPPGSLKDRIIPTIYQPAVDGLKNYLREVHCAQKDLDGGIIEVEVTLVFNNEELRKHRLLDIPYRELRRLIYSRDRDVESFKIHIDRGNRQNNRFIFKNIHSIIDGKNNDLNEDSIHGDPKGIGCAISYYLIDYSHPVIFVNTSNHAMAEHDANQKLWKWEYVPGVMDSPVILASKTRKEIDAEFDRGQAKEE
jgi:hypothetical protein